MTNKIPETTELEGHLKLPAAFEKIRREACLGCSCEVDFTDPCARCPHKKWIPMFCVEEQGIEFAPKFTVDDLHELGIEQVIQTDKDALVRNTNEAPEEIVDTDTHPLPPKVPPTSVMVRSAMRSATNWIASGFQHTDPETLAVRLETCKGCEFWNPQGFRGTGRCMKCGCSTWAKLRMASEKCPIGKW